MRSAGNYSSPALVSAQISNNCLSVHRRGTAWCLDVAE